MKFKKMLKEIRKLSPFLTIEEKDAKHWNEYCKKELTEAYM